MVGVLTLLESLKTLPPNVVTLAAATKTDVLPDRSGEGEQYVYRAITNLTGANLYVALDIDADNVANYHYLVGNGMQVAVGCLGRVSCYSVAGGPVTTIEQRRVRGT